jgi:hypothetical protein
VVLTSPQGNRIEFKVDTSSEEQGIVNSAKGKSLEEIKVVNEYPDVFPDELPGMPPDRDIEFSIELLPSTSPIYKRPYGMNVKDLAGLNKQIDELLSKGYIRPSSSPWGSPILFVDKKMVLEECAYIIDPLMILPSRTNTHYPGLEICLIR